MHMKSLTYSSVARPGLTDADLAAIHHIALDLNALDGITGILIYNGVRFLQIIEGSENAIDDLMRRLLADNRHSELTVEDERRIDDREFADWAMKLAVVSSSYLEACENIARELPAQIPEQIRARVIEICKDISQPD